jgi:hypothetical protein
MPARPYARLVAVLALAALAVACGSSSPAPASAPPSESPAPSVGTASTPFAFPLVSVEYRGGECPAGSCDRLLNIEADGRIHEVIPKDRVLGTAPPEVIDALRIEVEQADYLKIRGRTFTGMCPIAFDGQQTIYTFHVRTGDREIASCEGAIDPSDPLFVAVEAALAFGPPGGQPTAAPSVCARSRGGTAAAPMAASTSNSAAPTANVVGMPLAQVPATSSTESVSVSVGGIRSQTIVPPAPACPIQQPVSVIAKLTTHAVRTRTTTTIPLTVSRVPSGGRAAPGDRLAARTATTTRMSTPRMPVSRTTPRAIGTASRAATRRRI